MTYSAKDKIFYQVKMFPFFQQSFELESQVFRILLNLTKGIKEVWAIKSLKLILESLKYRFSR